jgi:hypothetical protein
MPYGLIGKSSKPDSSLLKRVLIAVGAVVLFVALFLWWQIDRAMNQMLEPVRLFAEVRHGGAFFGLNGDVGVKQLDIKPHGGKGDNSIHVDRFTIHTPGLFWLLRAAFADAEVKPGGWRAKLGPAAAQGGVPPADRLGITLENLNVGGKDLEPDEATMIGYPSGALFETLACGSKTHFTRRDLVAMGLPDNPTRLTVAYQVLTPTQVQVSARVHTEGVGFSEARAKLRVEDAERFFESDFTRVSTIEATLTVQDEGFVAARNRYCSQQTRQSRENYPERHLEGLRRRLLADGLVPTAPLERAYRRHLSRGEPLTLAARPNTAIPFEQFHHFKPEDRMRLLNAALTVGEQKPVPLAFTFTTPVPIEEKRQLTLEEQIQAEIDAERAARAALQRGEVPPTSGPVAAVSPPPAAGTAAPAPSPSPTAGATATIAAATPSPAPGPTAPPAATPVASTAAATQGPKPAPATAAAAPAPRASPGPTAAPVAPKADTEPPAKPLALALATPLPASGGPIEYADLKKHIGKRVRVETTLHSVRTGVLVRHTDTAVVLRLEGRERGLELTLPRQTVKQVSLIEGLLDTLPAPAPTPNSSAAL